MGKMRRFLRDGAVFAYSLGSLQDIRARYTITGAPTIVNSPYGNALNFDGTNDYVTLSAEEEYNLRFDSGTQDFSVVTWVRHVVTGVNQFFLDKRDGINDGWLLYFLTDDKVILNINGRAISSSSSITDGLWHCIASVVDRSGNGQMYIDGQADGAAVAIAGEVMATTVVPVIGARSYAGFDKRFNGDIYAVVIYDRVLTPDEVLDLATHKAFDY